MLRAALVTSCILIIEGGGENSRLSHLCGCSAPIKGCVTTREKFKWNFAQINRQGHAGLFGGKIILVSRSKYASHLLPICLDNFLLGDKFYEFQFQQQ